MTNPPTNTPPESPTPQSFLSRLLGIFKQRSTFERDSDHGMILYENRFIYPIEEIIKDRP
jgi:hypothetical protein